MTVAWCDAQGAAAEAPTGIVAPTGAVVADNAIALTFDVDAEAAAGDYWFTVSAGGATSDMMTLTVAEATISDPTPITAVPLTGIVKPVTGNTPSMVINGGTGYTAKIDRWSDEGTYEITDPFVAGTVYKAHITLTATSGYTFVDYITWSDFKPVAAASFEYVSKTDSSASFIITYPATEAPDDIPVTPARLTIGTPVTGEPVAQITVSGNSDQYSAAIREWGKGEWFEGFQEENFLPNTYYNAIVEFTPAEGYTFEGFTNTASVQGFKPENASIIAFNGNENGVLTVRVRFPITVEPGTTPVTLPAIINGIASPAAGVAPDTAADDDNGQFEVAAITWRVVGSGNVLGDTVEGAFAGDTAYAAEIKLKPKDGYRFAGLELLERFTVNGIENSSSNGVEHHIDLVVGVVFSHLVAGSDAAPVSLFEV